MADINKTIEIILLGRDKLSNALSSAEKSLDGFGKGMKDIASPFADISTKILKADAALTGMAAGGLAVAYTKAKEFNSSFVGLKKVFGDELPETLDMAKKFALEVSNIYGVSAASVLESVANWKQAGFDAKTSMELAKQALDAVIAGDMDLATATELQTAVLKGFNVSAEEAGAAAKKLDDIVNAVSNTYATNFKELMHAMGDISPIAKQAGFNMGETAAVLTPVIEVFRSGSESATAFKTALLRIIGDSDRVENALRDIGVAQRDASGKLRSIKDIYMDIAAAFKTLDENQKLYITRELVGIDQSARMVKAFDSMNKTVAITETALKSAGSAAEEVAVRMKSSEVIFNRFWTGLENLAVGIGQKFEAAANEAIKGGTTITKALKNAVDAGAFDPIFKSLNGLLKDLGSQMDKIAEAIPAALKQINYDEMLESLEGLKEAVGGLFGDVDLTDPDQLAKAIQAVIDTATSFQNSANGIIESWEPAFALVGRLIDAYNSLDTATQEMMGQFLGFGTQAAGVGTAIVGLGTAFGGLNQMLGNTGGMVKSLSKGLGLLGAATAGWSLGTKLREDIPAIDTYTQKAIAWVDSIVNFSGTQGKALDAIEGVTEAVGDQKAKMADLSKEINKATDDVKDLAATNDVKISVGVDTKTGDLKTVADKIDDLDGKEVKVGMSLDEFNAKRAELAKVGKDIESINAKGEIKVCAKVDKKSVDGAYGIIKKILPDGTLYYTYNAKPNKESLEKAKKEIDAAIPPVKKMEIQAEIEKERIKAQSEEIANYLKYKAEVDVAEIEAATERIVAMTDTINTGLQSTGDVIGDIIKSFGGLSRDVEGSTADNTQARWRLEEQLVRENELRERQVKLQEELVKAQVDYMNAKTDAMERGEAMIRIDATGLQEPLQSLFLAVIQECQVYATDEGLSFLGIA